MTKDYYKILGVSELCTESELKSAYRRLARKWHPDIAGNTEDVIKKFKEINEAYEILSDKAKKAEYDTINRFYNYSSTTKEEHKTAYNKNEESKTQNSTKPNFDNKNSSKHKGFGFNWEELIAKYKEYTREYNNYQKVNKQENEKFKNNKKGNDITTDVEITIAEAINGTTKIINMLNTQVCPICNGRKFINGNTCPHCKGKGDISTHKRFTVKIPAGVKDKSKIRLSEEGEHSINGGKNGDLYIIVHIKAPIDYETDGNNILRTITITPYEAVLGGNISVNTPDGKIKVKIAPCTQNGQKIRLNKCGLKINNTIGDMILTVEIQIPKNLSNREIELYKELQEIASKNFNA